MMPFDRIKSGNKGIDTVLDSIRLGDNVVWQLTNMNEYSFFVLPFVNQAIMDKQNIIYLRFAEHPPILEPQKGLKIIELDAETGFESFTVKVHEIIKEEGKRAFYVFDSLSELQSSWASDLMMGNFFRVTCPYLFELDTVAFFALLRNKHSYNTVAQIRDTTQLLIDVYKNDNEIFIHPLKVWNRYSQTMFLPHKFDNDDTLNPLKDGINVSRFYQLMSSEKTGLGEQSLDNWDRIFLKAKFDLESGVSDTEKTLPIIYKMLIGREPALYPLVMTQFNLNDFLQIKERMIGSGCIGGKAIGMLLARKIIENNRSDLYEKFEPHDSFYIGSDVFYTYMVQNGWWKLRLRQKTQDEYYSAAKKIRDKLMTGVFPENIKEQFRRMLEYFGQSPIIVRSSSLLEDSFGNAFAGKYESIFCVNIGSFEERFEAFEQAVKQVYSSSMNESALTYRQQRGLDQCDEQMAILVQRVSGSIHDDIFIPCIAGVGYSYNSYVWKKEINPKSGLVRLVLGLGTRAVDRTDGDYPRIASLDKPMLMPLLLDKDRSKYSQHYVDVLNLTDNKLDTLHIDKIVSKVPKWFKDYFFEHDYEAENSLRDRGIYREVLFSTCDKMLNNQQLTNLLKDILNTIQAFYDYPVDIEFTINFSEKGEFVFNLLQCRPLQIGGLGIKVKIPKRIPQKTLFCIQSSTMGGSIYQPIDMIILVDSKKYYTAAFNIKYTVARTIGKINQEMKDKNKSIMLIGPGRWGTSSPELGVPVSFAEISRVKVLCEVSYEGAGYMPELSFGSHFFQDLIEMEIFYCAIFDNSEGVLYSPSILNRCNNIIDEIIPDTLGINDIISVFETGEDKLILVSDTVSQKTLCYFNK